VLVSPSVWIRALLSCDGTEHAVATSSMQMPTPDRG
jgi:hypothetical protein